MSKQHYQTLFAYSWHTAQRLLDQAALLDETEVYAHPGFGHGSIYDLFVHLLSASQRWRVALETGQPPPRVQTAGFERLPAVRESLAQEYESWQAYLAGLSERR